MHKFILRYLLVWRRDKKKLNGYDNAVWSSLYWVE